MTETLHRSGYGDITLAHSGLFAHLDAEGTRPVELARRAGMTRQSMGELISDLVAKRYLERAADPTDGRAQLVRLTAAGEELARAARGAIRKLEQRYERNLGPRGLQALRRGLAEMGTRRT